MQSDETVKGRGHVRMRGKKRKSQNDEAPDTQKKSRTAIGGTDKPRKVERVSKASKVKKFKKQKPLKEINKGFEKSSSEEIVKNTSGKWKKTAENEVRDGPDRQNKMERSSDISKVRNFEKHKHHKEIKKGFEKTFTKGMVKNTHGKWKKAAGNRVHDKPDWKEIKKKKKDLKLQRKKATDNMYELGLKAKKLWEDVRRENCPPEKQEKLCTELYSLISGKVKKLIFAHDTVRVIECLMAVGTQAVRQALFQELKDDVLGMSKNKFAHFFVWKVLKYGSKEQKNAVMQAFNGRVVELMQHKIASGILECAYNEWANAIQRSHMVQEFYGPEYKLFKDAEVKNLTDALEKNPQKRNTILDYMKMYLQPIIDKEIFGHSIVHRLLYEYLSNCSENNRTEVIESLREGVIKMLHTRDGARVGMMCLWHGTNKDRKVIIKSMKTLVPKICMEEHGHMVLLAMFDSVDDTVLVSKAIITEIISSFKEIAFHEHGRKIVLYLLSPRNKTYFHPHVIDVLVKGRSSSTSKKDPAVRQAELLAAIEGPFLTTFCESAKEWLSDNSATIVAGALLKYCRGDIILRCFEEVAKLVCTPSELTLMQTPATHMLLKKMIQADKEKALKEEEVLFSKVLLENLSEVATLSWVSCNRGAFLLVNMIETGVPSILKMVQKKITPLKDVLQQESTKGAELLISKLATI